MLLKLAVAGKLVESVELNPVVRAEDYIFALRRERTCAQTVGFYLFKSVGQIELFLRVLSARALCVELLSARIRALPSNQNAPELTSLTAASSAFASRCSTIFSTEPSAERIILP